MLNPMTSQGNLRDLIILFGGVFALILASGQVVLKNRNRNNILLFLLLLNFGLYQIVNSIFMFSGSVLWYGIYNISFPAGIICLFNMGPLQYLYFHSVTMPDIRRSKYFILHFLPGLLFTGLFLCTSHPAVNMSVHPAEYHEYLFSHDTLYAAAVFLSGISFLLYMSFFLIRLSVLHSHVYAKRKSILRITIGLTAALILSVMFWLIDKILMLHYLKDIHVLLACFLIIIYILSNRYPEILLLIKSEIDQAKYIKTQLQGVHVDRVIEEMTALLSQERVFTDENLSLPLLAERLNIRPHQLSEIINSYLKTNFFDMLNAYRIKDAQRLFREKPELSIIEVTYETGYSSSSAFYKAFKKNTGISPAGYRRQNRK
jgi:AraC-like DNA-binding protein